MSALEQEKERIAIVTGGASGIGLAAVERLLADGYRVIGADRNGEQLANLTQDKPEVAWRELDVSSQTEIDGFRQEVDSRFGCPHVVVNAAGIMQDNVPLDAMDMEEHDRIWDVNYRGSFLMCRNFGLAMSALGRGVLINIASITALRPLPLFAYGPGKAAVVSMTESLAGHLGPSGVRVNAVAPGFVLTPPIKAKIEAGLRDAEDLSRSAALQRMVTPEEIAEAIAFLVSDRAAAITGITLPVDAGWLAGSSWGTYGGLRVSEQTQDSRTRNQEGME
ncbi:SDR family NAD(P)-dependent oxidoreductase [Fodinicurvata sediminis]|uniref:SDR family NAD(P)-dependent oxidoreductase n=1 Tax=Fodinicurvata sediminis TaxID=1121832 RepID=UPI0004119DBD|nr:SDR family oxidoreductase [Fodinicurvata sediminis]